MTRLRKVIINEMPQADLKTLQRFRDGIDEIDQKLIHLFDERASLVFQVGEWKKQYAYEVHDPEREKQILAQIVKTDHSHLKNSEIQTLFVRMIDFFRHTEKARTLITSAKESKVIPAKGTFGFLGFGLMGASVALALREQFPEWKILVHDPFLSTAEFESWNKSNAKSAFQIVNIHQLENMDFLFLAAPIDVNNKLGAALALKNKHTLNLGSYQEPIDNVIGFHPLAGKEVTGYQSAQSDLFYGKTICLTHREDLPPEILASLVCLAHSLGAEPLSTDNETHNKSLAYSSHLVQLLSMAFGRTLEKNHFQDLSQLIPNTAKEFLRLNGSDFRMWDPILRKNKNAVITALDNFEENLKDIKAIISALDTENNIPEIQLISSLPEKNKSKITSLRSLFINGQQIYANLYLKKRAK